ncbi:MAG: ketopantoate reductase family protein [Acidimicrobiales bacterium]
MKIAVVGAGAMGSIYAALLAEAGNEVWAVDTWSDHVERIRSDGLRIEGPRGDNTVTTVNATTDVADAGRCDLYIIATKASGVGAAAASIAPLLGPDSLVLTIQNGLGAGERIAEHLPTDNVLLGVAEGFGASMVGPGHAHHNAMRLIRIGEMTGGESERLGRLVDLWREAGFDVAGFDDIDQLIWEKFMCNSTLSGPCTAFRCTVGEVMDDPARWEVALGCTREVFAIGTELGINFSFDDPVAYITEFATPLRGAYPSMFQDHLAERPSEIDAINGMVPILGRQVGIATPYNDTITAVVRATEAGWT